MSQLYEPDDRLNPNTDKTIHVNGQSFYAKTFMLCVTCGVPDRYMYLSRKYGSDCCLECPICQTVIHTSQASVKLDVPTK